jgi:tetratricopeptide (TPR) repeat protein
MAAVLREYYFAHRLTHEAAYRSLLKSNRQLLHALAAEALRERDVFGALGERELLEELVRHATQAGHWQAAHDWLCRLLHFIGSGRDFAAWRPRAAEAQRLWDAARAGHPALPAQSPRLLLAQGDFDRRQGRLPEARRCLELALELAPAVSAESNLAGSIKVTLGVLEANAGNIPRARELQAQAVEELQRRGYHSESAMALLNLAAELHRLDRARESEACLLEALELARRYGNRRVEGLALGNLGILALDRGEAEEAGRLYEGELAAARDTGRLSSEMWALDHLAELAEQHGELARAGDLWQQELALSRLLGNRQSEARVLSNCGALALRRGMLDEAQQLLAQALELARAVHDARAAGLTLTRLGNLHYARGDAAAGDAAFAAARATLAGTGDRLLLRTALGDWRDCLRQAGAAAGQIAALEAELRGLDSA